MLDTALSGHSSSAAIWSWVGPGRCAVSDCEGCLCAHKASGVLDTGYTVCRVAMCQLCSAPEVQHTVPLLLTLSHQEQ